MDKDKEVLFWHHVTSWGDPLSIIEMRYPCGCHYTKLAQGYKISPCITHHQPILDLIQPKDGA